MLIGYCIIAVPIRIVTAEVSFNSSKDKIKNCTICSKEYMHLFIVFVTQN